MAKIKKPARQKYRLGQIVAIPLPKKKFAYAKVFKDYDLGVYNFISNKIEPLEVVKKKKFLYFNGCSTQAITKGMFKVIGEEPFANEKSAWAPPMASGVYADDPEVGVPHIDHLGTSRRVASRKEIKGLYTRTFAINPKHFVMEIVDRLVKGNNKKYRI